MTQRMTKTKFENITNCIDFEIDFLEKHLESSTSRIYTATQFKSSDETMTPIKSRVNSHHSYVPGKPHPNGNLSTSCGDANKVLLSMQLRRRINEDYESVMMRSSQDYEFTRQNHQKCPSRKMCDLITNLLNYSPGSVVVIDRLYGGLDVVEALAKKSVITLFYRVSLFVGVLCS